MRAAFRLPEGNVQIAFSGGRSSAFMLHEILEENGDLPDRVRVCFQNTGREMPETLDFVQECGARWGVQIVWLEYRPQAPGFDLVSHNRASRNGEPFAELIEKRKYLPNVKMRFCTQELKIRVGIKYLRSIGWERCQTATGIRADERSRLVGRDHTERWRSWFPLAEAGISRHDVGEFWRGQAFDLRLESVNGSTPLGNCDGCFLKSEAFLAGLARDHPERYAWWQEMESRAAELAGKRSATFSKRYSRSELRSCVDRQGDWIFETEGALCQAGDGECTG